MSRAPVCLEHHCPMVSVKGTWQCPVERIVEHLGRQQVKDTIPAIEGQSTVALVFANGHTLPIYCPDCGGNVYLPDDVEAHVLGRYLFGAAYQLVPNEGGGAISSIVLLLGPEGLPQTGNDPEALYPLYCHLKSARRLQCPQETIANQTRRTRRKK